LEVPGTEPEVEYKQPFIKGTRIDAADRLVYDLYGLTEEVRIVGEGTAP
jgi:hypothetical protein